MSGGGGSSSVDYPGYLKSVHSHLMWGYDYAGNVDASGNPREVYGQDPSNYSVVYHLRDLLDEETTPYAASTPYDPTTVFADIKTELDSYKTELDTGAIYDGADAPYLRMLSRFAGQFAMANAVNTSAFVLGIVLLESERMAQMQKLRLEHKARHVTMLFEYTKALVVAQTDYVQVQLENAVNNLMFRLNAFVVPANVLGAIGGSSGVTTDMTRSRFASGLSGMASGAAIGMSAGGPVGAGIGGLLGLGAGLFG